MGGRWGRKGGAGEAAGRDCIPSSLSSAGRGGGGAGPDTRVPAGPRSGLWVPEAASWNVGSSQDRTGQGPPKTPTVHTWSVWLARLRGGGTASVGCEQGRGWPRQHRECGHPLPPPSDWASRSTAASVLKPRSKAPGPSSLAQRGCLGSPRSLLLQTRLPGPQPPPPSDPQVLRLRPLLQGAYEWGLPASPPRKTGSGSLLLSRLEGICSTVWTLPSCLSFLRQAPPPSAPPPSLPTRGLGDLDGGICQRRRGALTWGALLCSPAVLGAAAAPPPARWQLGRPLLAGYSPFELGRAWV